MTSTEIEARKRILVIVNSPKGTAVSRLMQELRAFLSDRHSVTLRNRDLIRGALSKAANALIPSLGAMGQVIRSDTLIIHTTLGISAPLVLLARLSGTRVVCIVWDIYPEGFPRPTTRMGRFGHKIYGWLERRVLASAHHVTVPSEDFLAHSKIAELDEDRISLLPVWLRAEEHPVPPAPPRPAEGTLKLCFAGQLNPIRNLANALRVVSRAHEGPIELHVFSQDPFPGPGDGPIPARISVHHHGYVDAATLRARYAEMDAGIVSLSPDYRLPAYPSKTASYVVMGLPVLFVGPELPAFRALLKRTGVGIALEREQEIDLIAELGTIRADFANRQAAFTEEVALDWSRFVGVL